MQAHVQQVLAGIHVVQAFGQEEREQERFTNFASNAIAAFRRGVLVTNLSNLYTGLVLTLGNGVVLLIGAQQVIHGLPANDPLTFGTLLIFLAYLTTLQNQIGTLARTYVGASKPPGGDRSGDGISGDAERDRAITRGGCCVIGARGCDD